ncbi:hypothetical protein ACFL21_00505 [Patescibacteria group bacterium]
MYPLKSSDETPDKEQEDNEFQDEEQKDTKKPQSEEDTTDSSIEMVFRITQPDKALQVFEKEGELDKRLKGAFSSILIKILTFVDYLPKNTKDKLFKLLDNFDWPINRFAIAYEIITDTMIQKLNDQEDIHKMSITCQEFKNIIAPLLELEDNEIVHHKKYLESIRRINPNARIK